MSLPSPVTVVFLSPLELVAIKAGLEQQIRSDRQVEARSFIAEQRLRASRSALTTIQAAIEAEASA